MNEEEINAFDCDGYRPVHHAVIAKDIARLDQLLLQGALLNLPTEGGEGILSLAIRAHRDEEAAIWVKNLIDRGADIIERDRNGDTALHWAVRNGYRQTVLTLSAEGADPFFKNQRGERPIDLAHSNPTLRDLLVPKSGGSL